MSQWARINLELADHPKVVQLSSATAFTLYFTGILYSSRLLTDGFIPKGMVEKLLPVKFDRRPIPGAVKQLLAVGLWERASGGYRIHDYLDYQPSREQVQAKLKARAEAGRKGGKASGKSRQRKQT